MGESIETPVWVWLPGMDGPTHAGQFRLKDGHGHVSYAADYMQQETGVVLDPVHLPFDRRIKGISVQVNNGFPGVFVDAAPAGYGADRLDQAAKRTLSMLERLQMGLADGAGAVEVCVDINRKLDAWVPPSLATLLELVKELEETAPSSRAIRKLLEDAASTSAGGERPKVTVQDGKRLWLAKMQDRGDVPHLPAKEFVVMSLAGAAGLTVPSIQLLGDEKHKVYLIERFDRGGDPFKPTRALYASAHSVLGLDGSGDHDNPRRSYLVLADEIRRWHSGPEATQDCQELWRRMAFNVLVGNSDDHPRNHALIRKDGLWRLAPAFDITPLPLNAGFLSLACDEQGNREGTPERLLRSAPHFELDMEQAAEWLGTAARLVAREWQQRMTAADVDASAIEAVAQAFHISHDLAEGADALPKALEAAKVKLDRRRRAGSGRTGPR